MKYPISRLDKEFMTEMLIKTYGSEIDLDAIRYGKYGNSIQVWSDDYHIKAWDDGTINFAYGGYKLDIISAILNRMKTCDNCLHWTEAFDDTQGTCDLCKNHVDGDDFDDNGKKLEPTYGFENRVELSCDSDVYGYWMHEGRGEFSERELSDLFCDIRVLFGKNMNCPKHEFKEVK